jgi:DNA-binding NarL/FixJ family response regulator
MTRVLIVDDQPTFRRQLHRLLTRAGLEVVGEATDIPQAEALAQRLRPDLAVVDVMLPGIGGLEGVTRLQARAPGLRVVLISAHADRSALLQEAARAAGAESFVSKDELDIAVVQTWQRERTQGGRG